ncbi:hypothetical protein ACIQBJ_22090 [Kitasatospora sp. NPDC088391]|uniref:hypothetical protein n=1 Tax=Kitasatospora sp. NPDC088391 TaxID=3364074 RepID=UPI0037FD462A
MKKSTRILFVLAIVVGSRLFAVRVGGAPLVVRAPRRGWSARPSAFTWTWPGASGHGPWRRPSG